MTERDSMEFKNIALNYALNYGKAQTSPEDVIKDAQKFYDFIVKQEQK
jgi:hypothetical protein